jgi:hypothetical protein
MGLGTTTLNSKHPSFSVAREGAMNRSEGYIYSRVAIIGSSGIWEESDSVALL